MGDGDIDNSERKGVEGKVGKKGVIEDADSKGKGDKDSLSASILIDTFLKGMQNMAKWTLATLMMLKERVAKLTVTTMMVVGDEKGAKDGDRDDNNGKGKNKNGDGDDVGKRKSALLGG
jgi:hypothetical protein